MIEKKFELPTFIPDTTNENFIHVHQVHSAITLNFRNQLTSPSDFKKMKADGICTIEKNITIAIQTADCIPVLIETKKENQSIQIAAIHAGWRGVLQGIVPKYVNTLTDLEKENTTVSLGPSIHTCCFEVGEEVTDAFKTHWEQLWELSAQNPFQSNQPKSKNKKKQALQKNENSLWCDLKLIQNLQLNEVGISSAQIYNLDECTYCSAMNYASYRRSTHSADLANQKKRQWSWIKLF